MFRRFSIAIVAALSLFTATANGAGSAPPAQGRLFLGSVNPDFTAVNTEMTSLGLEDFGKTLPMWGAEATFEIFRFLELGINFTKRSNVRHETGSGTQHSAKLDQEVIMAVARLPVVKTSFMRFDALAGAGGSSTTLQLDSATQKGDLTNGSEKNKFGTFVTRTGASGAIGWNGFYLFVETGMETNKVETFDRTGTVGNNIQSVDFSGSYLFAGFIFDGSHFNKK